jgi:phage/conjugal plasmid C-4 type zinc finger TraR family protein
MDDIDRANDLAQMHLDLAIRATISRAGSHLAGQTPEHCGCCGESIPEARRQAVPGTQWCVHCADDQELLRRRVPVWQEQ